MAVKAALWSPESGRCWDEMMGVAEVSLGPGGEGRVRDSSWNSWILPTPRSDGLASGQPKEWWEAAIPSRVTSRAFLLVGPCEIIHSDWERNSPSRRLSHPQFLANKLDAHPSTKFFLLNSFCKVLLIRHFWLLLYLTPGNNQPLLEQLRKAGVSTRDRILGLSSRKGSYTLSVPPTHTDLGEGTAGVCYREHPPLPTSSCGEKRRALAWDPHYP